MPWPYMMAEFEVLRKDVWTERVDIIGSAVEVVSPPCVCRGTDPNTASPITWTVFARYNLGEIVKKGYGTLWLKLVSWCDVYFSILLHCRSVVLGKLVQRRDVVDAHGVGISVMSGGAMGLLRKMDAIMRHEPEVCLNLVLAS